MALIKCPECGREISDKAEKCIHCGKIIVKDVTPEKTEIKCPECGRSLLETDVICPGCGCPIERGRKEDTDKLQQVEVAGIKVKNKTKKIIIGIIVAVIVCAVGGVGFKVYSDKRAERQYQEAYNEYISDLKRVQGLMLEGGSDAETLCNLTLRVWHNAIYEDRDDETDKYTRPDGYFVNDFNEALANLYADSDIKTTIKDIEKNQASVKEIIKQLQNPPEGLDKCYDTVSDLYEAYKILTDLAVDPSGSYNSVSEDKSDAVSDFLSAYEKLDNQIPEEFEIK